MCWLHFRPLRMPRTRKQHYPSKLISYSYIKKIIRRCMEKYSLLTKLAKCTLNIALKLTFSVFLFFFVFWLHFRPPRHCLRPFFERQFFTQMGEKEKQEDASLLAAGRFFSFFFFCPFFSENKFSFFCQT